MLLSLTVKIFENRLTFGEVRDNSLVSLFFLTHSAVYIQIGFTFLVPAQPGSPGQRAVKRVCVCVCVYKGLLIWGRDVPGG